MFLLSNLAAIDHGASNSGLHYLWSGCLNSTVQIPAATLFKIFLEIDA